MYLLHFSRLGPNNTNLHPIVHISVHFSRITVEWANISTIVVECSEISSLVLYFTRYWAFGGPNQVKLGVK